MSVFHVGTLLDDADLATPDGRDRALDEVVPVLKGMPDSITRDELVRDVGERLGADPGLVARRLAAAPRAPRPVAPAPASVPHEDGGEESPFAPSDAGAPAAPRALSTQERREAGLLKMCIAAPAYGRDYVEKLKREHLSTPAMGRVRDWLAEHLDEPTKGLPEDDAELSRIVTRLAAGASDEPASPEAMELSFLQLEKEAIERRIAEAEAVGVSEASVELQKHRAKLSEDIAHHQSTVPKSSQPAAETKETVTKVIRTPVRVFRPIQARKCGHGSGTTGAISGRRAVARSDRRTRGQAPFNRRLLAQEARLDSQADAEHGRRSGYRRSKDFASSLPRVSLMPRWPSVSM